MPLQASGMRSVSTIDLADAALAEAGARELH